jgi:DNA-binding response OmpR family regulator
MAVVLICAPAGLDHELSRTLLWRQNVERHQASGYEQALTMAVAAQPDLTVIDRRLPRAATLVQALRNDPKTRHTSLVIVAPGDFESVELELLEAGANAILRLPANGHWDERLDALLRIPARREARFAVDFTVEGTLASGPLSGAAVNLSTHGMLLQSKSPLAVGDWITFAFRLPRAFIDGHGRVVRQAGQGNWGVLFDEITGDGRELIDQYVESLPAIAS